MDYEMKHIKQYETNRDELNLKKYIIWKSNVLNIFEVVNSDKQSELSLKRLFIYSEENDLLETPVDTFDSHIILTINDIDIDHIKKYIIYQSDNLQELVDIVSLIMNTNKYNI